MHRWPVCLKPPDGPSERVEVEVAARGATYTLLRLGGSGHPIHLSLVDAYLAGQVPMPAGRRLGHDSQVVLANVLGPPLLLYHWRVVEATLNDLDLLPPRLDGLARYRLCVAGVSANLLTSTAAGSAAADWTEVAVALPPARLGEGIPGPISVSIRPAIRDRGAVRGETPDRPQLADDAEARAWGVIEERLGRRLEERRKERISVRVIGTGRTTELLVGWSLVLPRNQELFAAWLGSDGRLELRPAILKRSK